MKNCLRLFRISMVCFLILSCQPASRTQNGSLIVDGEYDSEYPTSPTTSHLKKVAASVKLISILSFYRQYDFTESEQIRASDITQELLAAKADKSYTFEKPASGTATLIYFRDNLMALLTCAHVVDFPDTVFSYYEQTRGPGTFVRNVAIKMRQNNNVIDLPRARDFEILAMDKVSDIALIGKRIPEDAATITLRRYPGRNLDPYPVMTVKRGRSADLDWGHFVFLIGYPHAKKMISTAMVSSPDYDREDSFLLDGKLQRGISGGLVLAIRDGIPNFEWVGMTNAVSAETIKLLGPETHQDHDKYSPYTGKIYIRELKSVYYGITFAISIEKILEFIDVNKKTLEEKGYRPEFFFTR